MATSMPELPQETLEEIIDFLHDDRRALMACSLASSRLVPACRFHLFSEVTLEYNRMCDFLELLDVPWSSFASTVSKLVITGPRLMQSATRQKTPEDRPEYVPRDFSRLRERLASVKCVRFSHMCPGDLPPSFYHLVEEMKAVHSIEAHRVAFRCPQIFFGYLSSLPLLQSLNITRPAMTLDSRWEQRLGHHHLTNRPRGNHISVPLLDIRRLSPLPSHPSMGAVAGLAVLGWLLDQNPTPSVHSLRCNLDCDTDMIDMLNEYFTSNGSSIRKLWLTLPSNPTVLVNMPPLDFSPLTGLESIHIEGMLMSHQSSAPGVFEGIFRTMFEQLFSSFDLAHIITEDKTITKRPMPPLRRVSLSLTLDSKGAYTFYGMPDYAVLQPLTWCRLPSIIESALELHPSKFETLEVELNIKSTSIDAMQAPMADDCVRHGVWKRFGEKGNLRIEFHPVHGVDADEDGV